jgi:hypothetical protein
MNQKSLPEGNISLNLDSFYLENRPRPAGSALAEFRPYTSGAEEMPASSSGTLRLPLRMDDMMEMTTIAAETKKTPWMPSTNRAQLPLRQGAEAVVYPCSTWSGGTPASSSGTLLFPLRIEGMMAARTNPAEARKTKCIPSTKPPAKKAAPPT